MLRDRRSLCLDRLSHDHLVQLLHGLSNDRHIALRNGSFQRLGGIQHRLVMCRQGLCLLAAVLGFALKGLVQGLTECVPQFLGQFAIQRHCLRFMLPTLLQCFDRVNFEHSGTGQLFGFFNHGATVGDAGCLRLLQRGMGAGHGSFPLHLQFSKCFFAQMTTVAPAFRKLMQFARLLFPIGVACMGLRPRGHLGQQRQSLLAVCL